MSPASQKTRSARILPTIILSLGLILAAVMRATPALPESVDTGVQPEALEILEARLTEKVSIRDLAVYAYRENPSIRAARETWRAAVESYRVTSGYPEPRIMATYFPEPIETRLGPQDWNLTITQPIPFPGKLSKAGEVTVADARIARLHLDKTVRDIVLAVEESFWELTYIRKAKKVAMGNQKLLDHLRKVAETAQAQDRALLTDVLKAQSQSGQLRYDLMLLDDLEQTEATRLNGLLNREPDAPLGRLSAEPSRPVIYTLEEMYQISTASQEDILIADAQIQKAQAGAELARARNWPDFNLGLFYAAIGEPDVPTPPEDAGRDAFGIQAGMTIPLWLGKNEGRVLQAKAREESARARKLSRSNVVRTKIRVAFFKLQNAARIMALYRDDLLPQATKSLELAETWFRQGEGSFSDFIEAQSVLYNFQLAQARARADYGKYFARLERLTGRSPTQTKAVPSDDTTGSKK